jgi:hypothetical protein
VNQVNVIETERRPKGTGCVSNLTLDRALCGELPADEARALASHLQGCRHCAAASAALRAELEHFLAQQPLASLAADALARAGAVHAPWWRRWLVPALGLAVGAAGLMIVVNKGDAGRSKGGAFTLSPYVLHAEGSGAGTLHAGEPLHPGDRLQFHYNGTQGGYLVVIAVDAAGRVSAYYPPGSFAAAVEPGHEVPLNSAVELDATMGREVIVAVRCDTAVRVTDVMHAAADAAARARAAGGSPTDLGPLGLPCQETRNTIDKQPGH